MKRLICIICTLMGTMLTAAAQSDDFAMWYELGAEKKLSRKWSLGFDGELRTRNTARTVDRLSAGLSAEYKIMKGLKASAGYILLYDNNKDNLDLKSDGFTPSKYTTSYWGLRHRFNLSLQGSVDWGRLSVSLRERWQYTYRPAVDGKKYDFGDEAWTSVSGKGKNVLRSRLQLAYDIPGSKFDPFASVEMFNAGSGIEKMRYLLGVDYTYKKMHTFSLTYRYQNFLDDDAVEANSHIIGLSYKLKF